MERVDLLGRHYKAFARAFYKNKVYDKLPASKIPEFMRDVQFYIKDKLRGDNLPMYVKIQRAVEHCTRY